MNYSKHYNLLIERARNRVPPEGYIERHHVIPRCMGGSDDRSNLVALTPEEHYLAHLLLVKIHPENHSLVYAANKMTVGSKTVRRNNKRYGWLQRKFSEIRREESKGSGNTQHGTMWINKIGTTENKKIDKTDNIPYGWQVGRKIKIKKPVKKDTSCTECPSTERVNGRSICGNCLKKKSIKVLISTIEEFVQTDFDSINKFLASESSIKQPNFVSKMRQCSEVYISKSIQRKPMSKEDYRLCLEELKGKVRSGVL